ncbi:hypothetical protein GCK72_022166 [Caenorhabditis remanei]|uniref:Protein kinase domain-containing protein n=1 Tax=Caenorhabditis remanei TaxID=31234 RepID=A0A6A5FT77_CAERE|nr:hypothetical protein GCK72_022166 [Caenorhabditis remanei]KAF1745719.1 hypothetical protein GCK72_022166 [Caenorhabditis remanei]
MTSETNESLPKANGALPVVEADVVKCVDDVKIQENDENQLPATAKVEHFDMLQHIGSGAYGEVAAVKKNVGKDIGVVYAMKAMDKKRMGKHKEMVDHEWKILTTVRHPLMMRMKYAFQTYRHIVFIMPLAGGGDMLTMMDKGCLSESDAHFYLVELVEGVAYLHSKNILHRDLKLENLLIGNDGHMLITDYGLCATHCDAQDAIEGVIGTRHTMAPEVHLKKKYGPASDWWAVGITYCDMRSDKSVFEGGNSLEYSNSTAKKRPKFPACLSCREREFVTKVVVRDPCNRLGGGDNGTENIKAHNIFKTVCWQDVIEKKLTPPFVPDEETINTFKCFPDSALAANKFPTFE